MAETRPYSWELPVGSASRAEAEREEAAALGMSRLQYVSLSMDERQRRFIGTMAPQREEAPPEAIKRAAQIHDPAVDTLTGRALDYMGMGFLLVPPELFVLEGVMGNGPINWPLVLASFAGCYVVGFVLLAVGLKWKTIKPKLPDRLAVSISRIANSAFSWVLLLILIAFGPVIAVANFTTTASDGMPSPPSAAFFKMQDLENQVTNLNSRLSHANKTITELQESQKHSIVTETQKSPLLGLDDARRWQLTKALQAALPKGNTATCWAFVSQSPTGGNWPSEIWTEISPILITSGWAFQGSGRPRTFYPPGITVQVGTSSGAAFNCGYDLYQFLQKLNIQPVTFSANQTTPNLISCKNECVEMVIGDVANH